MAVTPGYIGSAVITWAASATASVVGQSIGAASADRIVVVAVTVEETATIDSCTIGGVAANVGISVRNTTGTPDNACAFFWLPVSTGTTATIAVTLSASSSQTGRISVWATTEAYPALFDSNSAQGAGTTQTLTGVTISAGGAGYWVFNNATTGTAVTWTNASERDDTSVGNYRHSVADSTTAGTNTITADGATTNQILAGISFNENPPLGGTLAAFPGPSVTSALYFMAAVSVIPTIVPAIPTRTVSIDGPSVNFLRPLYYQSKIAPPPQETAVVAPATMDWQQPLSKVPPRTKSSVSHAIYALEPPPPRYSLFNIQTPYLSVKVLQYQDKFEVLPTLVDVASYGWRQPFSTAPTKETRHADQLVTPYALFNNTETIDKWQFNWTGRPLSRPPRLGAQPFWLIEAVIPNTETIDKWQQPLSEAVPHGWPPYAPVTVPYYPYDVGPNTGSVATWLEHWTGPSRFWPRKPMALPFVPKEATSENTVTPDKWLVDLNKAARRTRSLPTQYQFPFTARAQFTVAWQQPLSTPIVKTRRVSQQTVASYPTPAFFQNTVTIDKWQQPLGRAAPIPPLKLSNVIYARLQPAVIDNTITIDRWGQPLSRSVMIKGPVFTAPVMYAPQVTPVEAQVRFVQVIVQFNLSTALYYQDITKIISPPPPAVVPPEPPVVKGWFAESEAGQGWTLETPAVCGVGTVGAFQEDAFQEDAFDVGLDVGECWTVEIPPANEWEEEEPDP